MNGRECISYYHSLPAASSALSKVITGYAEKFNQYLLSCKLMNGSTEPVLLVFFCLNKGENAFHLFPSLHQKIINQSTIPFVCSQNTFHYSLYSIYKRISLNQNALQSFMILQEDNVQIYEAVANFFSLMSFYPLPVKFVDGFLYELWNKEKISDNTFFEVVLSTEHDSSGLPRFAIRKLTSGNWILAANKNIWHDQALREDIQPITFYRDWIGAATGIKKIKHAQLRHALWIPVIKKSTNRKLIGFLHMRGENHNAIQKYELFWKNNLHDFQEAINNVAI